jgi:sec-independent protein translocase protein TatA
VFGNLGAGEIVILLVIVLLVFGANRLPEAGRAVGKGIREFQRALRETQDEINRPDDTRAATPPRDGDPKRLIE